MNLIKNKTFKFIFILFNVFGIIAQPLTYLLLSENLQSENLYIFTKYYFIILYLYSLVYIYITESEVSGKMNLISLFYMTFGLFLGTNILFDGFGGATLGSVGYFTNETFTLEVIIETILIITIGLIGLNFGYIYRGFFNDKSGSKIRYILVNPSIQRNKFFSKLSLLLFFPALISTVYKLYIKYNQASQYGYLSLYSDKEYISAPFLVNFLDTITFSLLIVYLIYSDNNKYKKNISIFYCFIMLVSMLSGARAEALSQILVITMYFSYVYGFKFKLFKLFIFALLLIMYSQYISFNRTESVDSSSGDFITKFLIEQGGSYGVISYSINHENSFDSSYKLGIVYAPLVSLVKSTLRLEDELSPVNRATDLLSGYSYAYGLSYIVNPDAYLLGYGLGSSYIAEVWIGYGTLGVLIVSFFIVIAISKIHNKIINNSFYFYILLSISEYLLIAPRGALFAFVPYLFRPILIYVLISLMYTLIYKRAR